MAVINLKKKEKNFSILDNNGFINDPRLSWDERGMLAYLMTKPDDWKIIVNHLVKQSDRDGRDKVYRIIKSLQDCGYAKKVITRNDSGQICGTEYIISEEPEFLESTEKSLLPEKPEMDISPLPAFPYTAEPDMAKPDLENPTLLNNNYTKKGLNKESKEAAAEGKSDSNQDGSYNKNAAASLFSINQLTSQDRIITGSLSENQKKYVKQVAQLLVTEAQSDTSVDHLAKAIESSLLNLKEFKDSKYDFLRKINTIKSSYMKGKWSPVVALYVQNEETKKEKIKDVSNLKLKIHEINSQINFCKRQLDEDIDESFRDRCANNLNLFTRQLDLLKQQLNQLNMFGIENRG